MPTPAKAATPAAVCCCGAPTAFALSAEVSNVPLGSAIAEAVAYTGELAAATESVHTSEGAEASTLALPPCAVDNTRNSKGAGASACSVAAFSELGSAETAPSALVFACTASRREARPVDETAHCAPAALTTSAPPPKLAPPSDEACAQTAEQGAVAVPLAVPQAHEPPAVPAKAHRSDSA